ncbi:MAG: hypothetical protein EOO52_20125 [Gammaproteobacteria bacterium]|nr:MAG: hypothetical protein EOO52_20125 [Gammaproteobacteria bacterium]
MLRGLMLVATLFWAQLLIAQKTLTAVKTQQVPAIDGRLEEAVWQTAPSLTDFTQNYPSYPQHASVLTEVRVLYDNYAFYVAARLEDDPNLIRKQITARDGEQRQDVDYFAIAFDTYNDQQNGFLFLVTPANVQTDAKLGSGSQLGYGSVNNSDRSWDAVWESNVQLTETGWTVEMRIPYISLRFPKKEVQTWGLQAIRFTRRNNEASTWNPVNPQQSGFINQFGKCRDLVNIQPPLRLSLSPYVTAGYRSYPEGSSVKNEFLRNGGMDVKYGINESFTLDATLVPDFGQVVSDNLINNLSPFEVYFRENRPFFTEGTELFNKAGLFYSRRIGAIPGGYYNIEALDGSQYSIEKNPSVTQLYNAIKLSGRTKNKLGIGVFNAVTAPMHAEVTDKNTGKTFEIETEPLTNYNIVVLDQALKGRSSITLTNTNVIRNGADRDANVTSFDWELYTEDNTYRVGGTARYSSIFGYTPYRGNINLVDDTIRRNGSLFVKPYDGFTTTVQAGKVSGKVQYNLLANIESDTYDPNDMGYLQNANEVSYEGTVSYNQLTPTEKFISYSYELSSEYQNLYKPYTFNSFEIRARGQWLFKNFWDFNIGIGSQPFAQHDLCPYRDRRRRLLRSKLFKQIPFQ